MDIDLPLAHVICTYYGNWLPGDSRGWRSRGHRIHSSGDYRSPPPADEHARLFQWARVNQTAESVTLDANERAVLGDAFVRKLNRIGVNVFIVAAAATHVHALLEPLEGWDLDEVVRRAKQYASHQLKDRPGRVWARAFSVRRVESISHARRAFAYIRDHGERDRAWVWRVDRDQ